METEEGEREFKQLGCDIFIRSFWRRRPSEHGGAEPIGPLCPAATGPEGDLHLALPAKQHGAAGITTHPSPATPRTAGLCRAFGFWQLGTRCQAQVSNRGSCPQQQPATGTSRHSYCHRALVRSLHRSASPSPHGGKAVSDTSLSNSTSGAQP